MKKIKHRINLEVTVPFESYNNSKKDIKVKNQIKRWVLSLLKDERDYIPLYINKAENGASIEDYTDKISVKVK